MTENFLFSNPMFKLSALRGVYKGIEKIVADTMHHGVRFAVKNPHLLIAGAIIIDFTLTKGELTKKIRDYFKDAFVTDAMKVYDFVHSDKMIDELTELTINTKTQPNVVARLALQAQDQTQVV